jgi:hypothetical protein
MVQVGKVDILDDEIEAANKAADRRALREKIERQMFRGKLERMLDTMEVMGENEMGWFSEAGAGAFHEATDHLRRAVQSLPED